MQTENILEALTLSFDYIDVVAELRGFPENSASSEYNNRLRIYDKPLGRQTFPQQWVFVPLVCWRYFGRAPVPIPIIIGTGRGRAIRYKAINHFPNPYDIRRLFAAVPHAGTGKKIAHFRWKYSNQRLPHPNEPGADCAPEDCYGAINDSDGAGVGYGRACATIMSPFGVYVVGPEYVWPRRPTSPINRHRYDQLNCRLKIS